MSCFGVYMNVLLASNGVAWGEIDSTDPLRGIVDVRPNVARGNAQSGGAWLGNGFWVNALAPCFRGWGVSENEPVDVADVEELGRSVAESVLLQDEAESRVTFDVLATEDDDDVGSREDGSSFQLRALRILVFGDSVGPQAAVCTKLDPWNERGRAGRLGLEEDAVAWSDA